MSIKELIISTLIAIAVLLFIYKIDERLDKIEDYIINSNTQRIIPDGPHSGTV